MGASNWVVNGRYLTQRVTGVQRYAYEIVSAIDVILQQDNELAGRLSLRLVVPPGARERPVLTRIASCETKVGGGHGWDQLVLPLYAGAAGILNLGNFAPLLRSTQIVCIHDANTFIEPGSYSRMFGMTYRALLPMVGRRTRRVATVSRFSADALVRFGVCEPAKIFVAPNGYEHTLRWNADRARNSLARTLTRPYILLLGSTAEHKNVDVVLSQAQAFDDAGIDLVVVGGGANIFKGIAPAVDRPNIHRAGYVGDDDLAALYQGALCLVFPSRTEGFGIPPLEAMAQGCPVISSNAASLIEVGGDAVNYVAPDDSAGWREAIVGLLANETLRRTMIERGRKRVELFSWKRSAEIYLEEILKLSR